MFTTIAVLGAGTMGYGFAVDFARRGLTVNLNDVSEEALAKGAANIDISLGVFVEEGLMRAAEAEETKTRIHLLADADKALADADMVIEALPEVLPLKHKVFAKADAHAPERAVFVTNSSSLRLSDICSILSPERRRHALMAHYFNPPEIMPLVELLALPETEESVMTAIQDFYLRIGKVPVRIKKDVAGLSANRIQMAVWRELLWQMENDIVAPDDLDRVLTFGPAQRWATTGAITMLDMTGLDIVRNIGLNLMPELDASSAPGPMLETLCRGNRLGLKTGDGFFHYPESDRAKVKDGYVRRLAKQLRHMANNPPKTGG